jgi:adenylate cyclase
VQQGELLTWNGDPDGAVEWIEKAMALNPFHPERFWSHLGRALFLGSNYEPAIRAFKKLSYLDAGQHAFVAASNAGLDQLEFAAKHVEKIKSLDRDMTAESYIASLPFRDNADSEHLRDLLIKAGMS